MATVAHCLLGVSGNLRSDSIPVERLKTLAVRLCGQSIKPPLVEQYAISKRRRYRKPRLRQRSNIQAKRFDHLLA